MKELSCPSLEQVTGWLRGGRGAGLGSSSCKHPTTRPVPALPPFLPPEEPATIHNTPLTEPITAGATYSNDAPTPRLGQAFLFPKPVVGKKGTEQGALYSSYLWGIRGNESFFYRHYKMKSCLVQCIDSITKKTPCLIYHCNSVVLPETITIWQSSRLAHFQTGLWFSSSIILISNNCYVSTSCFTGKLELFQSFSLNCSLTFQQTVLWYH